MDSACLACAFFAASSASRAAFSASFCFFTFHFGGVVTLMMVFRLRTGVSLPFSASVSVPVASALSCCVLPLTNHPVTVKDTTPVTAPERPAQPDDRRRIPGKNPRARNGVMIFLHTTPDQRSAPSSQDRPPPLHHWWQG
uniref:Secreted protein n=1 Tax=Shigella sonnei TaxID=624 RepID=A0A896Z6A2_SHISO|nr:hypothetical protein NOOHOHFM_00266 [Shigella sonnei]